MVNYGANRAWRSKWAWEDGRFWVSIIQQSQRKAKFWLESEAGPVGTRTSTRAISRGESGGTDEKSLPLWQFFLMLCLNSADAAFIHSAFHALCQHSSFLPHMTEGEGSKVTMLAWSTWDFEDSAASWDAFGLGFRIELSSAVDEFAPGCVTTNMGKTIAMKAPKEIGQKMQYTKLTKKAGVKALFEWEYFGCLCPQVSLDNSWRRSRQKGCRCNGYLAEFGWGWVLHHVRCYDCPEVCCEGQGGKVPDARRSFSIAFWLLWVNLNRIRKMA